MRSSFTAFVLETALNDPYLKEISVCENIDAANLSNRFKVTVEYAAQLIVNFINPIYDTVQILAPKDCNESDQALFPINLLSLQGINLSINFS